MVRRITTVAILLPLLLARCGSPPEGLGLPPAFEIDGTWEVVVPDRSPDPRFCLVIVDSTVVSVLSLCQAGWAQGTGWPPNGTRREEVQIDDDGNVVIVYYPASGSEDGWTIFECSIMPDGTLVGQYAWTHHPLGSTALQVATFSCVLTRREG